MGGEEASEDPDGRFEDTDGDVPVEAEGADDFLDRLVETGGGKRERGGLEGVGWGFGTSSRLPERPDEMLHGEGREGGREGGVDPKECTQPPE